MKKLLVIVLALVCLLGVTVLLAACGQEMPPVLSTKSLPETGPYVPEELYVEFFNTAYSNMSPWVKYPAESKTDAPATTVPQAEETSPEA